MNPISAPNCPPHYPLTICCCSTGHHLAIILNLVTLKPTEVSTVSRPIGLVFLHFLLTFVEKLFYFKYTFIISKQDQDIEKLTGSWRFSRTLGIATRWRILFNLSHFYSCPNKHWTSRDRFLFLMVLNSKMIFFGVETGTSVSVDWLIRVCNVEEEVFFVVFLE